VLHVLKQALLIFAGYCVSLKMNTRVLQQSAQGNAFSDKVSWKKNWYFCANQPDL